MLRAVFTRAERDRSRPAVSSLPAEFDTAKERNRKKREWLEKHNEWIKEEIAQERRNRMKARYGY